MEALGRRRLSPGAAPGSQSPRGHGDADNDGGGDARNGGGSSLKERVDTSGWLLQSFQGATRKEVARLVVAAAEHACVTQASVGEGCYFTQPRVVQALPSVSQAGRAGAPGASGREVRVADPFSRIYGEADPELLAALFRGHPLPRRYRVVPTPTRCHPCSRNPYPGLAAVEERKMVLANGSLPEGCLLGLYLGEMRSSTLDDRLVGGDLSGAEGLKVAYTRDLVPGICLPAAARPGAAHKQAPSGDGDGSNGHAAAAAAVGGSADGRAQQAPGRQEVENLVLVGDPATCPLVEVNAPHYWGSCAEAAELGEPVGDDLTGPCSCHEYEGRGANAFVVPCILKVRYSTLEAAAMAADWDLEMVAGLEVLRQASEEACAAGSGPQGGVDPFLYGVLGVMVTSMAVEDGEELLLDGEADASVFAVADQNRRQFIYNQQLAMERDAAVRAREEAERQRDMALWSLKEAEEQRDAAVRALREPQQQRDTAQHLLEEEAAQSLENAVRERDVQALQDAERQRDTALASLDKAVRERDVAVQLLNDAERQLDSAVVLPQREEGEPRRVGLPLAKQASRVEEPPHNQSTDALQAPAEGTPIRGEHGYAPAGPAPGATASAAPAQRAASPLSTAERVRARIAQLEAQNAALKAERDGLRALLDRAGEQGGQAAAGSAGGNGEQLRERPTAEAHAQTPLEWALEPALHAGAHGEDAAAALRSQRHEQRDQQGQPGDGDQVGPEEVGPSPKRQRLGEASRLAADPLTEAVVAIPGRGGDAPVLAADLPVPAPAPQAAAAGGDVAGANRQHPPETPAVAGERLAKAQSGILPAGAGASAAAGGSTGPGPSGGAGAGAAGASAQVGRNARGDACGGASGISTELGNSSARRLQLAAAHRQYTEQVTLILSELELQVHALMTERQELCEQLEAWQREAAAQKQRAAAAEAAAAARQEADRERQDRDAELQGWQAEREAAAAAAAVAEERRAALEAGVRGLEGQLQEWEKQAQDARNVVIQQFNKFLQAPARAADRVHE